MKKLFALIVLASGAVSAQTNLEFNATVSTTCALNVTQTGILVVEPQTPNVMVTSGAGRSGIVGVSYSGTPTITATLPSSFSTSPTLSFTPNFNGAVLSSSLGSLTVSNSVATGVYTTGSSDNITVDLQAATGSATPFPTGTYSATVTVSCV